MMKIKVSKVMMSLGVALMLGCYCIAETVNSVSSHFESIDKTSTDTVQSYLTSTLTCNIANDTTFILSQEIESQINSKALEWVSQISRKTSSTDKETIAKEIVKKALENDIDICFVLAQGTNETHLGSAGIGRAQSRHSLFGVYKTYSSYEQCINDYFRILNKYYLIKGRRTEYDLMRKYTTKGGTRYASDPVYEKTLASRYKEISRKTGIRSLQDRLRKLRRVSTET